MKNNRKSIDGSCTDTQINHTKNKLDEGDTTNLSVFVVSNSSLWHPIECARVRSAKDDAKTTDRDVEVQQISPDEIGDREPCWWCGLFCDPEEVVDLA